MQRLNVGDKMPDFTFETPFQSECTWSETVGRVQGKTALVFLRYYGCTLCQYDLHQFAEHYHEISATGGQLLVVLQSDPMGLAQQMRESDFPFKIVCDPEKRLYQQFEIGSAPSQSKLADMKTVLKIGKATIAGIKHGEYEGDELQLPAAFIMTPERTLTYVHYGKSAGDVPDYKELAKLLA